MSQLSTDRRRLLAWLAIGAAMPLFTGCGSDEAVARTYPVSFTDAQWRARLTGPQYTILRARGTERPFSSPLNSEHRQGTFSCAGCAQPLFSSRTKYDSHTGWPSFWAPLPNAVLTTSDFDIGEERTEVHCIRCGGHLGHVFDDGPRPTGKRYCMNGAAMTFRPG